VTEVDTPCLPVFAVNCKTSINGFGCHGRQCPDTPNFVAFVASRSQSYKEVQPVAGFVLLSEDVSGPDRNVCSDSGSVLLLQRLGNASQGIVSPLFDALAATEAGRP
jgi:hypothetical protein